MFIVPGMELFPSLQLILLTGWIPLAAFWLLELVMVLSFPRDRRGRLFEYDHSQWTRRHRVVFTIGKGCSLVMLLLLILTPLAIGTTAFYLGLVVYCFGMLGFAAALISFRAAPLDQPITKGFYRFSRNPQVLSIFIVMSGISLIVGSWTAFIVGLLASGLGRVRILEEEQYCLQRYGDIYREYLKAVPRYLILGSHAEDSTDQPQ